MGFYVSLNREGADASYINLSVLNAITASSVNSTFIGNGSQLTNLPIPVGVVSTSSYNPFTSSYFSASASFDSRINFNSSSIYNVSSSFTSFGSRYLQISASSGTQISNNSSSLYNLSTSYLAASTSFDTRINSISGSLYNVSFSYKISSGSIVTDSASFDTRIFNLSASNVISSASFDIRIGAISSSLYNVSRSDYSFTQSYYNDSSSFNLRINNNSSSLSSLSGSSYISSASFDIRILANSGSGYTISSSYTSFSSSYLTDSSSFNSRIINVSASLYNLSSSDTINSASVSLYQVALTNKTGSFATTGSNIFIGNQIITGSVNISGSASFYIPPKSLVGNNSAVTASISYINYFDAGIQTYSGSITWAGTSPSGSTNHVYAWTRLGNEVRILISLLYTFQGVSNTTVTIPLPPDLPAPVVWGGLGGASTKLYPAYGFFDTSPNGTPPTTRGVLSVNSTNNGYDLVLIGSAISARIAQVGCTYRC